VSPLCHTRDSAQPAPTKWRCITWGRQHSQAHVDMLPQTGSGVACPPRGLALVLVSLAVTSSPAADAAGLEDLLGQMMGGQGGA
jgi:hypothetical protein